MGDFANGLVIAMLVVAAIVFIGLWLQAVVGIIGADLDPFGKIIWLGVVTLLGPVGLIIWITFGKRDSGTERELRRLRRWSRDRQVDSTVDADMA